MQAMTFTELALKDAEPYLVDDDYVMEQKMDGARLLTYLDEDMEIQWLQRNGKPMKFAAAVQHKENVDQDLKYLFMQMVMQEGRWSRDMILDGEIMPDTGEYLLFDIADTYTTYQGRRNALEAVKPHLDLVNGPVRVVPQVRGEQAKRDYLRKVFESGGEGVMLKDIHGWYEPGKRVKSGFKVKNVQTADVVVLSVSDDPLSASFGVWQGGELMEIGRCSLIGKPHVEPGDVIEINYLYWTGKGVVQPRMMKRRTDKEAEECDVKQLLPYTKAVI